MQQLSSLPSAFRRQGVRRLHAVQGACRAFRVLHVLGTVTGRIAKRFWCFLNKLDMKQFKPFRFLRILMLLVVASCASKAHPVLNDLNQQVDQMKVARQEPRSIVFLITEDVNNYEAHKTVPLFAEMLRKKHGFRVTVLIGSGTHGAYRYPGMEPLQDADLLIVFARRIALPVDQMRAIKEYLAKGKPLIGIRTAHHAFA